MAEKKEKEIKNRKWAETCEEEALWYGGMLFANYEPSEYLTFPWLVLIFTRKIMMSAFQDCCEGYNYGSEQSTRCTISLWFFVVIVPNKEASHPTSSCLVRDKLAQEGTEKGHKGQEKACQ